MKEELNLTAYSQNEASTYTISVECQKNFRSIWVKSILVNLSVAESMLDFAIDTARALTDSQLFQGKAEPDDLKSIYDLANSAYSKLVGIEAEIKNLQENNII
jgi:hypothetical protein